MIDFRCPQCDDLYVVSDDLDGKTIRCRSCRELSRVSRPKSEDEEPITDVKVIQPKQRVSIPRAWKEPWYFGFLDGYAFLLGVIAIVFCPLGMVLQIVVGKTEAVVVTAVLVWPSIAIGLLLIACFVWLAVNAARDLRRIRQAVERILNMQALERRVNDRT